MNETTTATAADGRRGETDATRTAATIEDTTNNPGMTAVPATVVATVVARGEATEVASEAATLEQRAWLARAVEVPEGIIEADTAEMTNTGSLREVRDVTQERRGNRTISPMELPYVRCRHPDLSPAAAMQVTEVDETSSGVLFSPKPIREQTSHSA